MKKQLEVGKTYPTRDGTRKGIVLCDDLTGDYPCGTKVINIMTGISEIITHTLDGKFDVCDVENDDDLIIPQTEPTYRAWKEDEIPVGAVIMSKKYKSRMTINSIVKNVAGYYVCDLGDGSRIGLDSLYDGYEVLVDGKWQPCGVLE